jgi:hypothetical protein
VSLGALLLALLPAPLFLALRDGRLQAGPVIQAIVAGSAAESLIAVLQYAGFDPLQWLGWRPEVYSSSRMRVYGTLGNPDFVAAWLCATLPLAIAATRARRWIWAVAALQGAAILATGSRIFLLALAAAAVIAAARGVRIWKWCPAGLAAAGVLVWLSPARPLGKTIEGRLYFAQVASAHWRELPPFGYGPGSFEPQFARWQVEWLRGHGGREFAGNVDHAHNDYLEVLVEYGPVGLAAFLGFSGWLLAKAWRSGGVLQPGVWAGVAALLAIACVDFPFHRPAEWGLYWVLLGTIAEHTRRTAT